MDALERFLYGDDENDDNAGLDEILSNLNLNEEYSEDKLEEEVVEEDEITTKEEFDNVPHSHKLRVAKDIIKRKDKFSREMFTHHPRLFRTANKSLKLSRLGTKRRSKRKEKDDTE